MGLAKRKPDLHPVTQYAVDVVDGRIVAGKPVIWAAQRHLDDLEHGEKRAGLWFDEAAADHIFRFFGLLRFVEGSRAGQAFELELWQKFILGNIFGWMRDDGLRRFGEAWIEVGRGNGKSPMASGIGLYCLGFEGEEGAQCFTLATKREQARIIHRTGIRLRDKSPALRGRFLKLRDRLVHEPTGSTFVPLGRDSDTEDGWNPYCALADEVHAWKTGELWDVVASGMVKRDQPFLGGFTTAGYNLSGFGHHQHEYYLRLMDPESKLTNDRVFVYIAMLNPRVECSACKGSAKKRRTKCEVCDGRGFFGDDPYDERNWVKANPNLGVSVKLGGPSGLRARAEQAKQDKRIETDFFVKNLNIWGRGESRALSLEAWDACGRACPMPPETELRQRPCYMGLDLSSSKDLTALALYWPKLRWRSAAVKVWTWLPRLRWEDAWRSKRVDYRPWIDAGWITTTARGRGLFIDHEAIRTAARKLAQRYLVKAVGADPKYAEWILPRLEEDGLKVSRLVQSFANLTGPWLDFERLIGEQGLAHGGNPVLRFAVGNVVLRRGGEGDLMPSKATSHGRIDPVAGTLNAMRVAVLAPDESGPALPPTVHPLPKRMGGGKREIYTVFE
jgi:phage terminase large subunit-like protein